MGKLGSRKHTLDQVEIVQPVILFFGAASVGGALEGNAGVSWRSAVSQLATLEPGI